MQGLLRFSALVVRPARQAWALTVLLRFRGVVASLLLPPAIEATRSRHPSSDWASDCDER
jgi:hypothetical protein